MKRIFIAAPLLSLCILSGCSTPAASSRIDSLAQHHDQKTGSGRIISDLTRSTRANTFIGIGGDTVTAYPLTGALLEAQITEEGVKTGKSAATIKKQVESAKQSSGKVCFHVNFSSSNSESIKIKYWGAELVQNGKRHPAKFGRPEKAGYSSTYRQVSSYNYGTKYSPRYSYTTTDITTYYNSDTLCANSHDFDFTKSFDLVLQPRYKKDLKPMKLTWSAPSKSRHS